METNITKEDIHTDTLLTASQRARRKYRAKVDKTEHGREKNKQYTKTYYHKNKEEINMKRKQRFAEDPEYREKIMQQVKRYVEKKKAEKTKLE